MSRPLTVLQVLPELEVGGVERGTVEIARALVAAGHRAVVVSGGGRLVGELTRCGAEHITLGIGIKRPWSLRHVPALARLMRERRVDLVHARSRLPAWLAWLARARLPAATRPRWVTTVHGPYTVNRYSRIMVSGERVIAISEFIRDYIARNYPEVPATQVRVVPRGVERARWPYRYRAPRGWQEQFFEQRPYLLERTLLALPARLTRWKGQTDFLALIARLRAAGRDDVHGLLIGAAHPRKQAFAEELRARVSALGIDDAVSFLGQRSDLREVLAISRAAYSLTAAPEAFGRTTIEALSLGVPVIGYDHGGTGEILARLLPRGRVPVGDVDAAVIRTLALLDDPGAATWRVPECHPYTVEAMQEATLAVYAELCA
ncbi:MAG: glycosyltransferase [Gammaproteobacteria bacterium]